MKQRLLHSLYFLIAFALGLIIPYWIGLFVTSDFNPEIRNKIDGGDVWLYGFVAIMGVAFPIGMLITWIKWLIKGDDIFN